MEYQTRTRVVVVGQLEKHVRLIKNKHMVRENLKIQFLKNDPDCIGSWHCPEQIHNSILLLNYTLYNIQSFSIAFQIDS